MPLRISERDFKADRIDGLLERIPGEEVVLSLNGGVVCDMLTVGLFLGVTFRSAQSLSIIVHQGGSFESSQETYRKSLLAPLIGVGDVVGNLELGQDDFVEPSPYFGENLLVVPTRALACETLSAFEPELARALRESRIQVPKPILHSLASIAFEIVMNAEEHGTKRVGDMRQSPFRFLAVAHHPPRASFVPSAAAVDYIKTYESTFRAPEGGWLELLVIDTGMGMAFPSYYVDSEHQGPSPNLYLEHIERERSQLSLVLSSGFSTKARWGKSLTTQTQPGMGTEVILLRLKRLRSFAGVRTGRSSAQWSEVRTAPNLQKRAPFLVNHVSHHLYLGTAWSVMIPITDQTELPL